MSTLQVNNIAGAAGTPTIPTDQVVIKTATSANVLATTQVQNTPHGLGRVPNVVGISLLVQTAVGGYSVGDEIFRWADGVSGVADSSLTFAADTTNLIFLSGGSASVAIYNKTTGAAVAAAIGNFRMKVYYT